MRNYDNYTLSYLCPWYVTPEYIPVCTGRKGNQGEKGRIYRWKGEAYLGTILEAFFSFFFFFFFFSVEVSFERYLLR